MDARGIPWDLVAIDRADPVPYRLDDVSGLAFLGGTMSVNDGYPWLAEEMRLIRSAAVEGVPMLGHCLGSQLIAKALGGTVAPMAAKEIGWHPVQRLENPVAREWLGAVPERVELLIWHHEAFTLPPGSAPLLSGEHCPVQAYALGNIVATVAHPEVTGRMLEDWLRIYGHDIGPLSPSVQAAEQIRERLAERCARMHRAFTDHLYDAWMERIEANGRRIVR